MIRGGLINHLALVHPERLVEEFAKDLVLSLDLLHALIEVILAAIFKRSFGLSMTNVCLFDVCRREYTFLCSTKNALALNCIQHGTCFALNRIADLALVWRMSTLLSIVDFLDSLLVSSRVLQLCGLTEFMRISTRKSNA